jgi:hypothetical protein
MQAKARQLDLTVQHTVKSVQLDSIHCLERLACCVTLANLPLLAAYAQTVQLTHIAVRVACANRALLALCQQLGPHHAQAAMPAA